MSGLRYDVVIVGSSLGGLASGAMLANRGFSVAVVDTDSRPGWPERPTASAHSRCWRSWAEAKRAINSIVDYLHRYYADLEECTEWSSYQSTTPPSISSWYTKPVFRHPVKVETLDGLYVASASAEGDGSWIDVEAGSALLAVELAEAECGHLCHAA
jgi:thioredoxin reductase